MAFNRSLQLSMHYGFNTAGVVEILQFEASSFVLQDSLHVILLKLKELKFFQKSMTYLRFSGSADTSFEKDEFGNYNFDRISADDYSSVTYDELISGLSFEERERPIMSIKDINSLIRQTANPHLTRSELFYELNISPDDKEKLALTCIWEEFKNFIGIDKERKSIHLIAAGRD